MGSWGTALYSNDTASDVRDICNEVYPLVGIEEGNRIIMKEFDEIIRSDVIDNDNASFWFALADWQWKHGVLSDDVRVKATALLSDHAGIDEWEEDGTAADVRKRIKVMDELLTQINSPMPPVKIKKARMLKPRHNIGDIVVLRTCSRDHKYGEHYWNIDYPLDEYMYVPEIGKQVSNEFDPPFEAYEKYFALLCVGVCCEPHSQYVDGYFDEYSVYAFYDYLSDELPTKEILAGCGFLPTYVRYSKMNMAKVECCMWEYKAVLHSYTFRNGADSSCSVVNKYACTDEAKRFNKLYSQKNYSDDEYFGFGIEEAFVDFFEERIRLQRAGIPYDNLLREDIFNPPIRTPEEVDAVIAEEIKQWFAQQLENKSDD